MSAGRYIHITDAETSRPVTGNQGVSTVSEWQKKQVKQLGEIVTGRTPSTKRKDFYGGDYRLISPADLDNGKYVTTAHRSLTKLGFEQCRALPKDTVLVGCIGNVGKLGIVGDACSATNQQVNALICNSENDSEFVYYCFHENRERLERAAVKTTVPILSKTNFSNFDIYVPLLCEQKKIAHILSTVQQAIEAQEKIIQTTTELKKALMHKLFTEGTRGEPQKETEIGLIPESWKVVPLKSVASKPQYGVTATAARTGDAKFLRITDITDKGVNWDSVPFCVVSQKNFERCRLESGDIVFARIGATTGKSYLIKDAPASVFASYLIRVRSGNALIPGYLIQFFQSAVYWEQINANKHANLKKGVNASILSNLMISLPPLSEQEKIAEVFGKIENRTRSAWDNKVVLQDIFRTLLHELMTAKIRVHRI